MGRGSVETDGPGDVEAWYPTDKLSIPVLETFREYQVWKEG